LGPTGQIPKAFLTKGFVPSKVLLIRVFGFWWHLGTKVLLMMVFRAPKGQRFYSIRVKVF
jgi:hypothetical protein